MAARPTPPVAHWMTRMGMLFPLFRRDDRAGCDEGTRVVGPAGLMARPPCIRPREVSIIPLTYLVE